MGIERPRDTKPARAQGGVTVEKKGFDPVLVEVVKNELAAITEEMAIAVWKLSLIHI